MIYFAISLYAGYLFFLYKTSPVVGDSSVFGFRKLVFIVAAAELPYLFYVSYDPNSLHMVVKWHIIDFEAVFLKFLLMKALFLTTFCITAFHLRIGRLVGREITAPIKGRTSVPMLDLLLSLIMLLLMLITFTLLIIDVGGWYELLMSWRMKSEVLRGTAVYRVSNLTFGVLAVGFFINFLSRKPKVLYIDRIVLCLIVVVVFVVLVSVGERKNPIFVVAFAISAWHFRVRPIRLLSPLNIALLVFFITFAAIFPDLRKQDAMLMFFDDPVSILVKSIDNLGQLFARISDLETSLFIYSYFDSHQRFWYGATFPDLFTGFIPSSLLPTKPPIDEGVYIYALAHGYDINPPVPFRDLIPVGWPTSRITGPFVQFGSLAVLFGGLVTGLLMRWLSKITLQTCSPASLFVYVWAQLSCFGLTNAFIFNLILILVLLAPVHFLYWVYERRQAQQQRLRAYTAQMQHAITR